MKPDALQRGLVGEIIHRFERKGLKIIGMKMMQLEDALLDTHYAHHKDKPFFGDIKKFMKSAPVIAIALSGINGVSAVRTIVGPIKGYEAPPGTIRGDFSLSIQANVVHASDSPENGAEEVARFFSDDEIFFYRKIDFGYIYSDEASE